MRLRVNLKDFPEKVTFINAFITSGSTGSPINPAPGEPQRWGGDKEKNPSPPHRRS